MNCYSNKFVQPYSFYSSSYTFQKKILVTSFLSLFNLVAALFVRYAAHYSSQITGTLIIHSRIEKYPFITLLRVCRMNGRFHLSGNKISCANNYGISQNKSIYGFLLFMWMAVFYFYSKKISLCNTLNVSDVVSFHPP